MEHVDYIFDIIDVNNDSLEYTTEELNRYFESGHLNSIIDEDEIFEENYFNDFNNIQTTNEHEEEEEVILSQKLSQLSTKNEETATTSSVTNKRQRQSSTSSSPNVNIKKIKMINSDIGGDNDTEKDEIPTYLLITNKLFVDMTQQILKPMNSTITLNDIQQVALLMHQMGTLRIKKQITIVYLQSVTGDLKERDYDFMGVDRRVWPLQVKSLMLTHHKSSTTTSTNVEATTTEMNSENVQATCEHTLHRHLEEMNEQTEEFQKELNKKKISLIGFTTAMEDAIQIYVQHYGIKPLKMKRDFKIATIKHDYDSEILTRQYLQEKPNEYQIEVAKRLLTARREAEKSKRELLELKQRVFYNKPPRSFDSVQISMPTTTTTLNDSTSVTNKDQAQYLNKYEKMIQSKKLDLMAIEIKKAEVKYYECQMIFDMELANMWSNHRNRVENRDMTTTLTNLIELRLTNITDRWRDIYNYRINSYIRNSSDKLDQININDKLENTKRIGFLCTLFIDTTKHKFTNIEEIQLLNRGPAYVPPCQMYVSSSLETIDDIVRKQYAPFKRQLTNLFSKHKINISLTMEIQNKVYKQFHDLFSMPIPSDLQQRAMYEKKLIQSIRYSLNTNNLILRRTADNMNVFYLGNSHDFEAKANKYLLKSNAYEIFTSQDDENSNQNLQNQLKEMIESMNMLLETLKIHKAFENDVYNRLHIDTRKVKLPYLYFLPDVSQENELSLVPFITSQHSATWRIGKFLNQLLRPFVDKTLQPTTFRDEIDFIQKLNRYVYKEHRLRPRTLFCTIQISNYYTLDTHKKMIEIVDYFLEYNLPSNRLGKITILNVKNLLHLFLHNNIFCYKDTIYKFTKGSPNTMALTETLSNIYLFAWQKSIANLAEKNNELFGRYKDRIFFTWNQSTDEELRSFLQTLKEKYPHVEFQRLIGSSVHYLNACIENRHGKLYYRIDHNPITQRYTLPYVIGHSKLAYSDWLRSALIRAVCYCRLVDDFHQERIYLELTCLVNGYSLLFVETHVQHFFNHFHAPSQRYSMDQSLYDKFRQQCFDYIAVQHEHSDQLQKLDDQGHVIYLNYIYEYGPRCRFDHEFHHLWSQYFNKHPLLSKDNCTILPTTKHLYSLNALLTQHKSTYLIQQ